MSQRPVPAEPWRFAGGRVWLDEVITKDQDDTLYYLEGCASSPIGDQRKVADKTEAYRKYARRLWDMFCKHVLSKAGPEVTSDPEAVALDLCHNRASAENKFRAFLRHYVKTSVQLRPSLGPEEYEWVRVVESAISVTELWKALVRQFDSGFLQEKRRQDPERASLYSMKFSDTATGTGSVWKISKWIREDLTDELGLARGQLFEKQEVTGEDALAILTVLWTRPDLVTASPADRLAFHVMVLLGSIGAFRPGALECIQYRQVQLAVVTDPTDGCRQLVATITINFNKNDVNALRRSQDDRIKFSVTFAPCPLVCVLSPIVARAIKDDAFDVGFDSLDALLTRPQLGDSTTYLPLQWKEEMLDEPIFKLPYHRLWAIWRRCTWALGCRDPPRPYAMRVGSAGRLDGVLTSAVRNYVVDNTSEVFERSYLPNHFRGQLALFAFGALAGDYETLFRQLCNSSLKVDKDAPMSLSAEEKVAFEQRRDLRAISIRLAGDGEGESPGWRTDLHSRASYIRASLAKQLMVQRRKEYFIRVDRERALGFSCGTSSAGQKVAEDDEACASDGAADIGLIFRHFLTTNEPLPLGTLKTYSKALVAYLQHLPAEAAHLARAAVQDGSPDVDSSSAPLLSAEPPLRPRVSATTSWCLLGCGSFSRRPNLNRHVKRRHLPAGSFAKPFECPECRRLGWAPSIIDGASHWSVHVEVHHDERDAPNLASHNPPAVGSPGAGISPTGASQAETDPAAPRAACLLCDKTCKPKGLPIHYSRHKNDRRFLGPFECPECMRQGQATTVEGFAAWREHADTAHGRGGSPGYAACRMADKRSRGDTTGISPPAKRKRTNALMDRDQDEAMTDSECPHGKDNGSIKRVESALEYHGGTKHDPIII